MTKNSNILVLIILGPERENWIRAKYIARAFVRIDALKVDNEILQGKK